VQPVFENIQFRTFDVWVNNQPVMIWSAEAHFPPAPGATAAPEQYLITLVARTDIYGNLRKLYSGVTDKFHLDVTPRLELIDAVDADGDGRGELLFRETTDAGSGYVIYRPTGDKLWKMFDSLAQE
jgi:glucose dehydrogenase